MTLTTEQCELVESNMGLARAAARSAMRRGASYEDVLSDAYLGLCRAAANYDPTAGAFAPYAYRCAWGSAKRGQRDASKQSRSLQLLCAAYQKARIELESLGVVDPSCEQVGAWAGMDELDAIEAATHTASHEVPLDVPLCEGADATLVDSLPSHSPDPFRYAAAREELREIVDRIASPRDAAMLLRSALGETQRTIAESYGLSQMGASRAMLRARERATKAAA